MIRKFRTGHERMLGRILPWLLHFYAPPFTLFINVRRKTLEARSARTRCAVWRRFHVIPEEHLKF
jgi:hypothetical protein